MRIISERRLREFWEAAKGAERDRRKKTSLEWITVVKHASWNTFTDVAKHSITATFSGCTIFDLGGNRYRIIAKIAYRIKVVFIREVLTHAEYDEGKWKGDCG